MGGHQVTDNGKNYAETQATPQTATKNNKVVSKDLISSVEKTLGAIGGISGIVGGITVRIDHLTTTGVACFFIAAICLIYIAYLHTMNGYFNLERFLINLTHIPNF
jgi:uncharacterized membrane protein YphA (DoxX/SURF4 family)